MEWKKHTLNYLFIFLIIFCGFLLFLSLKGEEINFLLMAVSSVFIFAFIISLVIFNKKGLDPESKYLIKSDEIFVSCYHPEKGSETAKWKEISEVVVVTTDKGPYQPYIWILLATDTGKGCMFPLGAKNSREVIEKILGFESLDFRKWEESIKSVDNKRFSVWKRK
jgi:hypothetical protein